MSHLKVYGLAALTLLLSVIYWPVLFLWVVASTFLGVFCFGQIGEALEGDSVGGHTYGERFLIFLFLPTLLGFVLFLIFIREAEWKDLDALLWVVFDGHAEFFAEVHPDDDAE